VPPTEEVRLAELMTALSLATDVGLGEPFEHAQRSALAAAKLAALAGLPLAEAQDAFYLALLKTVGCAGDDDLGPAMMGEDLGEWMGPVGGAGAMEMLSLMIRNIGHNEAAPRRVARVLGALSKLPQMMEATRGHCEVGVMLARRLGLGPAVVRGLGQVFEKWDGSGQPKHLRGEAIDRPVRLAQVAADVETGHRVLGPERVIETVRRRRGHGYDPQFADLFCRHADEVFAVWNVPSVSDAVLAAEPGRPELLSGPRLDEAIRAIGEYGDIKSRYTRGHSADVS
jgi:hypothetical protein